MNQLLIRKQSEDSTRADIKLFKSWVRNGKYDYGWAVISLDCRQSVFSKYFSRDYEERLFSLAFYSTRPYCHTALLRLRWLNTLLSSGVWVTLRKKNRLQADSCIRLLAGCFFQSRNFSRDYEKRLFSLKENGTGYGLGTHEKENKLQTLLMSLRTFQFRSQGLFHDLGAGREKALASANHVST